MELTDSKLIRADQLSRELTISKTTLWRWRKEGLFPEPISLGPRIVVWETCVINDWFEKQKNWKGE